MAPGGIPRFDLIFNNEKTTQLSTCKRLYGPANIAKFILLILEDLNNYFNVARPMTPGQLSDLAIELTGALWAYRLEEILAFAEAVKKGTYGKIYERLDQAIIWEQLAAHEEARSNYFMSQHLQHKQSDPHIDSEDGDMQRGFTSLSGAVANLRDVYKAPVKPDNYLPPAKK